MSVHTRLLPWMSLFTSRRLFSSSRAVPVRVYVWTARIGHAAIEVGDHYLSIWPSNYPAATMATRPIKAILARELKHDSYVQTVGKWSIYHPEMPKEKDIASVPPDKKFEFNKLNTLLIKQEMQRIRVGIEAGHILYQLCPNVTYKMQQQEVYNCTLLTSHLLRTGGGIFSQPVFRRPWGITPKALVEELQQMQVEEEKLKL